ncbi:MAG: glycoside hydrolase family 5 protein [Lentisphaerae bacterium]|jgi:aryl-phospho-beta-D-glucosidase BglC (GH1 family)|nr:glycoside hydrolase family 5 protein [Lentisphaerota bacterium]
MKGKLGRLCMMMTLLAAGLTTTYADVTYKNLPRWHGFNLLEKFYWSGTQRKYQEWDFAFMRDHGFNFARLPMDYRHWIIDGDPEKIDETVLLDIDEAVALGKKYGIHICLNFHRAPGYTVAKPAEKMNLWKDPEARRICAMHWGVFAKRYKGIPSSELSFNLFNEPSSSVSGETYAEVVEIMLKAIHAEDPNRLVICDGLSWGGRPCMELAKLGVAQATRGYQPMEISHYKASWVNSEHYPYPTWPTPVAVGWLTGAKKPDQPHEMVIAWNAKEKTKLRLKVGVVSQDIELKWVADGKTVWSKTFVPGPGEGEWKKSVYSEQWKIYQNVYDLDCFAEIPAGTRDLRLVAGAGDWVTFSEIGATCGDGKEVLLILQPSYGRKQVAISFDGSQWSSGDTMDRNWLKRVGIDPWKALMEQGIGVMVGEFGAHNKTPHDVTLSWLEDNLANWQSAGWGWAMWNLRGSFGILDSGRDDVAYEDYQGHKLDRKMLELLMKYK